MVIQPVQQAGAAAESVAGNAPAADLVAERRAVTEAVRAVNEHKALGQDSEVTFTLDRATHRPLIRVVDRETREVVRQIPPEYVLKVAEALKRAAGGR